MNLIRYIIIGMLLIITSNVQAGIAANVMEIMQGQIINNSTKYAWKQPYQPWKSLAITTRGADIPNQQLLPDNKTMLFNLIQEKDYAFGDIYLVNDGDGKQYCGIQVSNSYGKFWLRVDFSQELNCKINQIDDNNFIITVND